SWLRKRWPSRPTSAHPRDRGGLHRLQQLPLGGAVLHGPAHVGDHAVLASAERQDADDDHLAMLDRELLAFADRQGAHRGAGRRVLRVLARQPLRPGITVGTAGLRLAHRGLLTRSASLRPRARRRPGFARARWPPPAPPPPRGASAARAGWRGTPRRSPGGA